MALTVCIKKKLGAFTLDVNLQAENEILALLGASGCGKSMTLKCIAGIVKPDEGHIQLDERVLYDSKKRINLPPQQRKVGYLFQNYALFPNMTVLQNIAAGVQKPKAEAAQIAQEKARALYLTGLEEKYPGQLSGGQQQRVALARILASQPDMIMLDEPFTALDSCLKWQLEQELVDTLAAFPGTTLFVSHSRDEVYRVCDRVCVMEEGLAQGIVPVKELFDRPRTLSAALLSGCKNYAHVERREDGGVWAREWNVALYPQQTVGEDIRCVGVRAHHLRILWEGDVSQEKRNLLRCKLLRVTDDVFSTILTLLPEGSPGDSDFCHLRVELDKDKWQKHRREVGETLRLYVRPEDILLLR